MMGGGRLISFQSFCTLILLELALMLGFWVGDYLPLFFSRPSSTCDVTNSSIVRKIVLKNWSPVFTRYGVSLPVECPLNLSRDYHGVRESIKATRSSHWQCLKCGKKFYLERHLDLHIERRHNELINKAEDSVCLGKYCDIMRCDVLKSSSFLDEETKSTDVSIWTPIPGAGPSVSKPAQSVLKQRRAETQHSVPVQGPEKAEKPKSLTENCDEHYFSMLREKCANLVWECLQGLISVLDAKDFKAIQSELESVSCSYLSCSRYGDKCCSSGLRAKGKLRPFFIVFGTLFISLCLALAYYFTWIYTQNSEDSPFCADPGYEVHSMMPEVTPSNSRQNVPLINRTTHL